MQTLRLQSRLTRRLIALGSIAWLCAFTPQNGTQKLGITLPAGPTQTNPGGNPIQDYGIVDAAGNETVLHEQPLPWGDTDYNGDGVNDRADTLEEDAAGNKLVRVCVRKSAAVPAQYIAYGYQAAGQTNVQFFGKCAYKKASNVVNVEASDTDGDGKGDYEKDGAGKSKPKKIKSVTHDNIDAKESPGGAPVGTEDRHYRIDLEGPNAGKCQTSKTKGQWVEEPSGRFKYVTDGTQTQPGPWGPPATDCDLVQTYMGASSAPLADDAQAATPPCYLAATPPAAGQSAWNFGACVNPGISLGGAGSPPFARQAELSVNAGDELMFFGYGLNNARVVPPASLPEYGEWTVKESSDRHVVFEAKSTVQFHSPTLPVPNAYTGFISGLLVDSDYPVGACQAGYGGAEISSSTLIAAPSPWDTLGFDADGAGVTAPTLVADGDFAPGGSMELHVFGAPASSVIWLVVGASRVDLPFLGAVVVPALDLLVPLTVDASGRAHHTLALPANAAPGSQLFVQASYLNDDLTATALSNALVLTVVP